VKGVFQLLLSASSVAGSGPAAFAAASFNTCTDSISFGFIERKLSLLEGKPSITYKGSELPLIEPIPLITTLDLAPG
jgi:hypothetical protein